MPVLLQALSVSCHIMRVTITIICFFYTLKLFGQINDGEAFFSGNYDKDFVRLHYIKQVSVESFINESKKVHSLFEFDSNGLLTQLTISDSIGKKVNDYLFTYNKQGDQIERKNIAYELDKTYVVSFNKIYNGSQLIQETSSEHSLVKTYSYDELGRIVRSTTFFLNDTTIGSKSVSLYNYDGSGKLTDIQDTYIENNSSVPISTGKTTYLYNTSGNITEIIRPGIANYELNYGMDGLLQSKARKMPDEFSNIHIVDKYSYSFWK